MARNHALDHDGSLAVADEALGHNRSHQAQAATGANVHLKA